MQDIRDSQPRKNSKAKVDGEWKWFEVDQSTTKAVSPVGGHIPL
jgi:hypothetical protein